MGKKSGKLASRYSRALLESVEKELGSKGAPTPAQKLAVELQEFSKIWKEDKELSSILSSPMFAREQRASTLASILSEVGVSDVGKKFLRVVFQRDRIAALPEIAANFSDLADRAASVVRVNLTTARKIDKDEMEGIEKQVCSQLGGKPDFTWQVKPEILGGLIIEYSGQILDGSLGGQLSRLEKELTL